MVLDPRIALQAQGIQLQNPMDIASKAMTMRQMALQGQAQERELQKDRDMQEAYKAGIMQNPDGTSGFDGQVTMSALANKGYGREFLAFQKDMQAQKAAQQEAESKKWQRSFEFVGRAAPQIRDQAGYDQFLATSKQMGLDTSGYPPAFGPEAKQRLDFYGGMALSQLDKLNMQKTQAEIGKIGADTAKSRAEATKLGREAKSPGFRLSEGQKVADREFAKDYNDWTSGGASSARSEIGKLRNVAENLRSKKVTTGGLTGLFSDRVTSNEVLRARADVESTVMNSLRAILGAQFTEKEGERIIKTTWNEADSTENNLARLDRLVGDLEAKATAKDEKSRYYQESGGTIAGYNPIAPRSEPPSQIPTAQVFKTSQIEWAD